MLVSESLRLEGAGFIGGFVSAIEFVCQAVNTTGGGVGVLADPVGVAFSVRVVGRMVGLGAVGADRGVLLRVSVEAVPEGYTVFALGSRRVGNVFLDAVFPVI